MPAIEGKKAPKFYVQCRHTHHEPEVLLAEDVMRTQIPCPSVRIIQITKYGEDP
jgi:hypothetical protein